MKSSFEDWSSRRCKVQFCPLGRRTAGVVLHNWRAAYIIPWSCYLFWSWAIQISVVACAYIYINHGHSPVWNKLAHYHTGHTIGRLTDVSLNKNGGSWEAVKNKGSVWVEGERIRSPFLTRRKITQRPRHSRNKFSLHLIFFEIFEIQNPANWGLLNREET